MPFDKVYIVGFMGSGKTTEGKKLASVLGWTFIDLDQNIENITGMTIPQIFSEKGEAAFRKIETETLHGLEKTSGAVISTGGGAPCHDDNMHFMRASGITVYLKLTPEQLRSRLIDSKTERPLIKGLDKEELLDFIRKKLASRDEFYKQADIIIEGCDLNISELEKQVRNLI